MHKIRGGAGNAIDELNKTWRLKKKRQQLGGRWGRGWAQTRPGLEPRAAPGSSSPLYVYGTYASKLRQAARLALTETKSHDNTFQMLTSSHGFRVQPQGCSPRRFGLACCLLSVFYLMRDSRLPKALQQETETAQPRTRRSR